MRLDIPTDTGGPIPVRADAFRTTDWSMVLGAGSGEPVAAEAALARLCGTYWYPLYAFVRGRGHTAHDAQDLTQSFFVHLLDGNILSTADRRKGKFRSFLLSSIKNFLANDWDRKHTAKRGGRYSFVSWDDETPENLYQRSAHEQRTPEQAFERNWASVVLETVHKSLKAEYSAMEKVTLFESLEACVSGDKPEASYAALGKQLGMTEGAMKMAALRLRKRYREILRMEIASTVATEKEVDEEISCLVAALTN